MLLLLFTRKQFIMAVPSDSGDRLPPPPLPDEFEPPPIPAPLLPHEIRDNLPPLLRRYCPSQQECRLWSAECRSFIHRWLTRVYKGCGRGWSVLDSTARLFLVCTIGLVLLAVLLPRATLWGFAIAGLLVFGWRARRWRDLDRKGRSFVVCGNLASVVALVFAVGGLSGKPGDETRNVSTLSTASDKGTLPNPSPQSTATPVVPRFRYNVTDLGTLGGAESHAEGINNNGQVVGGAWTGGDKPGGHAFLWDSNRGMQDLGTLGGPSSCAKAINNAGQIVGSSDVRFQDSLGDQHAFLWENGRGMQDLGRLATRLCRAYGINKAGQVVGYGSTLDHSTREGTDLHAFQWDAQNGMCDMATHGIRNGWASSINDSGQIVGMTGRSAGPGTVAFLWQAGRRMRELGTLGGDFSWAFCINNVGQAVGLAYTTKWQIPCLPMGSP